MSFPSVRMRRLRKTQALRDMLNPITLNPAHLIYPIFVEEAIKTKVPIKSMPGYSRVPLSMVVEEAQAALSQGIKGILLFGIPTKKDEAATSAYDKDGVIQQAIRLLKKACGDNLVLIADVCLCEYMSHGHCGVVKDNQIQNDSTLALLAKTALSYAQAGIDIVAPSAMMDGQISSIRETLDEAGYDQIPIIAYAAKYASGFYGPFRDAADSTPKFGDRRSYQMNPGSPQEALREIELDIAEGADMIMIKPALAYLDIITLAKASFNVPVVAYNVSGEYSMVRAAAQNGWIDEQTIIREILLSMKRAGADLIISYHAKDVASWLT